MNFNSINTVVSNAASAVSNALDFSRWEQESTSPRETITDLALTGDEVVLLQSNRYGLSEKLADEFDFLKTRTGKTKALLRASIAFEHLNRDCTYEQLAQAIGCTCNTAYQHGLKLREAYENAFGLHLTSTSEGLHLANIQEAELQNERVLRNFEKHILPSLQKFGQQLRSLQQTNQQYSISARTNALLTAALTEEENS